MLSYKQVIIKEPRVLYFIIQSHQLFELLLIFQQQRTKRSTLKGEEELRDCSKFEQLYLIGKTLGVAMTLETIIAKATTKWKVVEDVSIVDMRNGFVNLVTQWLVSESLRDNLGSLVVNI